MITRVPEERYLNIFELLWLFLAAEYIVSMQWLKLYDINTDEYDLRRLFWYTVALGGIVTLLVVVGLCAASAIKYLL